MYKSSISASVSKEKKENALKEFTKSQIAINTLINQLYSKKQIQAEVEKVLNSDKLDFTVIEKTSSLEQDKPKKEMWIEAIYQFKVSNNLPTDGIVTPDSKGKTVTALKKAVKDKVNKTDE